MLFQPGNLTRFPIKRGSASVSSIVGTALRGVREAPGGVPSHVVRNSFDTVSPRNPAEISAGLIAIQNQTGRSNPRLRGPILPTVTNRSFRPVQIRKLPPIICTRLSYVVAFVPFLM